VNVLPKSDLTMSEIVENDGSRKELLRNRLDGSTIGYLWNTFRAFEHEVVRANEVCLICSDTRFQDDLSPGTQSQEDPVLKQNFAEVLHRSRYCWLCRFLCRIVARASPQEHFTRCVNENLPVTISILHGHWERQLLLSVDIAAPAGSYQVDIDLPRDDSGWRDFEDLLFHSVMTCHNSMSPPSKRFQKLLSDFDTQRRESYDKIRRWLSLCESRHPTCRQRTGPSPSHHDGFRVIDVNTRTLCEPAGYCSYVALSYVWGEKPFSRACSTGDGAPLLSDLIQQIKIDLPLPQMPQTIEDAIIVTQNLSQRYLWVDLLCIDQLDLSLRKKAITAMDKIYSRALLTICVIDGSSMFSGIPGVSEPLSSRYQVITDTEINRYLFTRFHCTNEVLEASDWARRAWTFQEGELSTRRLCFSKEGIFLRCKEEIFHDVLELDESDDRMPGRFDTGGIHYLPLGFDLDMQCWDFDTYARMAASYSHRSMTFPSDAYDAIRGTIQRMAESLSTKFVAATPLHDLCNALLWFNHFNSFGPRAEGRQRPGFPSWSWLGWEGPIEYWYWLQESRHPIAKQECIFSLVDRNSDVLYRDAVKVRSSALATFESIAPDTSNAVLKLTTTIARFRIVKIMESKEQRHRRDHWWLLLDQSGQKISQETTYYHDGYYDHNDKSSNRFCSLHLHPTTSVELIKMNVEDLEFVSLQHWASNPSGFVPEKLTTPFSGDDVPEYNRVFEDTVWTMAIKRRPDGVGERLNIVSIPAKAWFMAEPQSTAVSIA